MDVGPFGKLRTGMEGMGLVLTSMDRVGGFADRFVAVVSSGTGNPVSGTGLRATISDSSLRSE